MYDTIVSNTVVSLSRDQANNQRSRKRGQQLKKTSKIMFFGF